MKRRWSRYRRQMLVADLGEDGQQRLADSSVLVVGCGALGNTLGTLLVRAGVGAVHLIDPDVVELHNLHRQILFDEEDAAARRPKAEAAAAHLRRINSEVSVHHQVRRLEPNNVKELIAGVDLVLDATDDMPTRYVLNDACVKHGRPWIYGGVLGTFGMTMNILPGKGPCFRCVFPDPPPPGTLPATATEGVLGMVPVVIASLQATEACKLLVGSDALCRALQSFDLWSNEHHRIRIGRQEDCPACGVGRFEFLPS